jgi:hypothetical protein
MMTQSAYRRPSIGPRPDAGSTSFPGLLPQNHGTDEERTSYPGLLIPPNPDAPSSYPHLLGAPHVSGCTGTWRSIT